jgi:CheY-like chemotaxis protein
VKDLVELHGGSVAIASAGAGRGTTVTVTLPSRSAMDIAALPRFDDAPLLGSPRNLAGVRVLVVDDDPDAVEIVTRTLVGAGAAVASAASAAEALSALSAGGDDARPHVIIADVDLPSEKGYALLPQLRRLPAGRVPAVAVSASATKKDRSRAVKAGFTGHVAKPFMPRLLVMAVAGALADDAPDRRHVVRDPASARRRTDP